MFEALTSWPNLLLAYRKASRGKRGGAAVAAFEHRLEDNLFQLQRELRTRTYGPGRYQSFYIHEPKRRLISAAPFRDRVVHHAVCNLLEPIFERSFVADSYANRRAKGTHRALERVQGLARTYRYALQCDVRQFFPSIDHWILRGLLSRKVEDDSVLWLIDAILESGRGVLDDAYEMVYFPGDDLFAVNRSRGLPIGNLTSQFWANVYLNPIDHFIKRELGCAGYVRYVDDLVIFHDTKRTLWEWKKRLVKRLERLRLTLHQGAQPQPVSEGLPFLGFVVFADHRRLKRRKAIHFERRLREKIGRYLRDPSQRDLLLASIQGWVNHARYGNTVGLRRAVIGRAWRRVCAGGASSGALAPASR